MQKAKLNSKVYRLLNGRFRAPSDKLFLLRIPSTINEVGRALLLNTVTETLNSLRFNGGR
jgi:hypothetical protein